MSIRVVNATNERGLFVSIKAPYPLSCEIDMYRECASQIERDLLRVHLAGTIGELFKEVRAVSYAMGWRDAKSKKRAKREHFPCSTRIEDWERKQAGL